MSNVEAKLITHLSEREIGTDIHIVKEVISDEFGTTDRIKIYKDYQRPFWITKPLFQNHVDKKEAEDLKKLQKYTSTESQLYSNIARRLGERYMHVRNPRILKGCPFLYGSDVDSRTILKNQYAEAFTGEATNLRYGVIDIEKDVLKEQIIVLTIATKKCVRVALLDDFVKNIPDLIPRIRRMYKRYIPEVAYKDSLELIIDVHKTEVDMIKDIFYHANYMNIDVLAAWNALYDMTEILDCLKKNNIDPAGVFHYDAIPKEYMFFQLKEGRSVKKTEAGREIPLSPEERWHTIKASTNYTIMDAMATHRYIRVGGATTPGGYSLDNILEQEEVAKKLKFDEGNGDRIESIEWHIHMVAKKPVEYIVYNIWDNMSMLELDSKTNDMAISLELLSGVSHFDIFSSGPRRLVDAIYFFYLKKGKALGVRDPSADNDKKLGLDGWVITLISFLTTDIGLSIIKEDSEMLTSIMAYVMDSDISASYPNCTLAANVSKDTTHRELLSIIGVNKELFKRQNMNLSYGKTNAVEYCQQMFQMPSLYDIMDL